MMCSYFWLGAIPGSKGLFPHAKIVITSLKDAEIAWNIVEDKLEYEINPKSPMITLRITPQLPEVLPKHVDIKMEQIDERGGGACVKTEDLEDGAEDKIDGERIIKGADERNIAHVEVKEEQMDDRDEIMRVRVNNIKKSTEDTKNSLIEAKKKTEVSTVTNSLSLSYQQTPVTRITMKSGKNTATHTYDNLNILRNLAVTH